MQKNIIKIILISIIILIIVLIGLIFSIKNINKKDVLINEINYGEEEISTSQVIQKVTSMNDYYTVKECMQEYLESIYTNETKIDPDEIDLQEPPQKTELEIKEKIYNLLGKNYIKANNITIDNVLEYVEVIKSIPVFTVNKMLVLKKEEMQKYIVCGNGVKNSQLNYYIVTLDKETNAFSVEPIIGQYNSIDEVEITETIEKIERNTVNKIKYSNLEEQTMCMHYLMNYKSLLKNNIDTAYEMLNKTYKAKRFPNIEYFKEYLIDNKDTIDKISLDSYLIEEKDGYIKYTCQDKLGNIYEFQATAVMEYTAKLDTHTDSTLFDIEYNKRNESDKALFNIEKVIQMTNTKDYRAIYEKLDMNFKNNNFKTYESFKEYVKNNLFEYNKAKYEEIEKSGQYFICKTTITDKTKKDDKTVTKTFIIKLLEGTDFVFSFNVE